MSADWKYALQVQIETHLKRIEKILGNDYRLTLVARCTRADLKDADILLTMDDCPTVVAAIERLADREPTISPEPKA